MDRIHISIEEAQKGDLARARLRLAGWRTGENRPEPVGQRFAMGWLDVYVAGVGVAALIGAAITFLKHLDTPKEQGFLVLTWILLLGAPAAAIFVWRNATYAAPTSPEIALKNFYHALRMWRFQLAADYVCPSDFDGSRRLFLTKMEAVVLNENLADPERFRHYWSEIAGLNGLRFSEITVFASKIKMLADDLYAAEVAQELVISNRRWPYNVNRATYPIERSMEISRLVVRNNHEWLLWSGEFVTLPEKNLTWLDVKPANQLVPRLPSPRPHLLRP